MTKNDELLTDDYVAELLSKEASDCSLKYSSMGLDAYKSAKRPSNQPKPNTRFLNNIIRDTNSHNRALLAKENAESQARLRDLEHAEEQKREEEERKLRRSRPGPRDTRKRMLGDIAAIVGGTSKRRKTIDDNSSKPDSNAKSTPSDWQTFAAEESTRQSRKAPKKEKAEKKGSSKELFPQFTSESSRSGRHHHRRDPHDHRSTDDHDGARSRAEWGHRHRDRSPRHHKPSHKDERLTSGKRKERHTSSIEESDSDPLEDLIGPVPATNSSVRRRGRGVNAASSGIDSRFAPDYDPRKDVTPEPEDRDDGGDDDWDMKAQAFRDRQQWKHQGAARLRSAGFTEDQIKKWEKGDEKDEVDVKWTERGAVRAWDVGKVVDSDGGVSVGAEWTNKNS
ncbi:hypothetical protein F4778DRAFT_705590 [Xylariomycetidae sp. FL2044]|nr:hypothetical protein F4778DRAFT_705590 [Xylariomycetidae sp. FL2044]